MLKPTQLVDQALNMLILSFTAKCHDYRDKLVGSSLELTLLNVLLLGTLYVLRYFVGKAIRPWFSTVTDSVQQCSILCERLQQQHQ